MGWVPIAATPLPPPPVLKDRRKPEDEKMIINVSGRKFETWRNTLEKYPDTCECFHLLHVYISKGKSGLTKEKIGLSMIPLCYFLIKLLISLFLNVLILSAWIH